MGKKDLPAVDFQAVLARKDPKLAERLAREGVTADPAPPLIALPTPAADPETPANTTEATAYPRAPIPSTSASQPGSTSSTRTKSPSKTLRKRGLVARADGREAGRITVYVPPELALRLRKYCFERDRTMTDVAGEVLVDALQRRLAAG